MSCLRDRSISASYDLSLDFDRKKEIFQTFGFFSIFSTLTFPSVVAQHLFNSSRVCSYSQVSSSFVVVAVVATAT